MDARAEILSRIAAAGVEPTEAPRHPVVVSPRPHEEVVAQFAEYAAEYKASVLRCPASAVAEIMADLLRNARALLPPGFPSVWIPAEGEFTLDAPFSSRELDRFDAVLTLGTLGIAETGTVVLDHGPGQGRRALTLVPDRHVILLPSSSIVESVAEAVARLEPSVKEGRPLTWISGPSATSDIELERVEGVHGPRQLVIVIVEGAGSSAAFA